MQHNLLATPDSKQPQINPDSDSGVKATATRLLSPENPNDSNNHLPISASPNNSISSYLPDPSAEYSSNNQKPNNSKLHAFQPHSNKLQQKPIDRRLDFLGVDGQDQGNSHISFPASLMSPNQSVEYRSKNKMKEEDQIEGFGNDKHLKLESPSLSLQQEEKKEKKKRSFLSRGLNHIKKTISNKSILKNKKTASKESIKRSVTYKSPEIMGTPVAGIETPNQNQAVFSPENEANEEVGETEKSAEDEVPVEKNEDLSLPMPRNERSLSKGSQISAKNDDSNILRQSSDKNSKQPQHKSPNLSSMKMSEFGRNSTNIMELDATEIPSKPPKEENLFKRILKLLLFIIFFFVVLTILGILITFPYENFNTHLWASQFFHGFLLAGIPFLFLRQAIRSALEEASQKEKSNPVLVDMNYARLDMVILACLLMPASGVIMVKFAEEVIDPIDSPFLYFAGEVLILIINIAIISCFFYVKNYLQHKKAKKTLKQTGFFFIPVYRDFLADLYSTRSLFNERGHLQDRAETLGRAMTNQNSATDRKSLRNDEGIDKYKPLNYFQIVTNKTILNSQLLVVIVYCQLLAMIGLIELYNYLQDEDHLAGAIILMLFFRIIMSIFTKLLDFVDRKCNIHIQVFTYYLNTAFSAMFCRAVLFHSKQDKYIWVLIGCKAAYRVVVYGLFGLRIDYWKIFAVKDLRKKFSKSQKDPQSPKISEQKTGRKSIRSDTLSVKQFEEIAKATEAKVEKSRSIMRMFAIRFFFGSVNDVFYSVASLGCILGYDILRKKELDPVFNSDSTDIFIKGTGIEIGLDFGLLILIGLVWKLTKRYNFLPVRKGLTNFFAKYAVSFVFVNIALLVSFLLLIQSLEVN